VDYFKANPKHLHYDPGHESPTLLTTAIASLLVQHWKELFSGKTFEDLDLNHDGVISPDELQTALVAKDMADAIIDIADVDGSGDISKEEWEAERNKRGAVSPQMRRNIIEHSHNESPKHNLDHSQSDTPKH